MLATLPSGCWAGVGTQPCLWAGSSLPQSLPAALCPAFLASPAAQIPAALEAGCSPQGAAQLPLTRPVMALGLSPSRAHTERLLPEEAATQRRGSWTHPAGGRAALFGCQTRGNKVPASGSRGAGGLVLGETQTVIRVVGVFGCLELFSSQVFEPQSLRNASGHGMLSAGRGSRFRPSNQAKQITASKNQHIRKEAAAGKGMVSRPSDTGHTCPPGARPCSPGSRALALGGEAKAPGTGRVGRGPTVPSLRTLRSPMEGATKVEMGLAPILSSP